MYDSLQQSFPSIECVQTSKIRPLMESLSYITRTANMPTNLVNVYTNPNRSGQTQLLTDNINKQY